MNTTNLDKVVQAYIDNFDYVNGDEHQEYYKWEAFKHFKDNWDIDAENFVEMFKESVKLTYNLIDNKAVSPTNGIVKLAERSELTEVIREMFRMLFIADDGNIVQRQKRIEDFRDRVNDLLDKYEPGKWRYQHDFRTVLSYLNMRYPKENYLFKATEAKEFMYCIEYPDDFGSGKSFNLSRYYRMCDALLEKIKDTPELMQAHKNRLTDTMLSDDDYHIMVFDIIYCVTVYKLYADIAIKKTVKKSSVKQQRNAKAEELNLELDSVNAELDTALIERSKIDDIDVVGWKIRHKVFGPGTVISQDEDRIIVKFAKGEKKFELPGAFSDGYLICEDQDIIEIFSEIDRLDKKISSLRSSINRITSTLSRL
jgi:hypothetical protein